MSTLNAISEKELAYHQYQARQEFLGQQRSVQQELQNERAAKEAALQAKEAALAEGARLQALLNQLRE